MHDISEKVKFQKQKKEKNVKLEKSQSKENKNLTKEIELIRDWVKSNHPYYQIYKKLLE